MWIEVGLLGMFGLMGRMRYVVGVCVCVVVVSFFICIININE
jgi:hypothetical protein